VVFNNNTITKSPGFGGSYLKGYEIDSIVGNRMFGLENQTGLEIVRGPSFVANNYISIGGIGTSKAIVIGEEGDTSKILFNSISNSGNNSTQSIGIEINSLAEELTIKNNIFGCVGGGMPLVTDAILTGHDLDYNCYYSPNGNIASIASTVYGDITQLGQLLSSDANSVEANPYYNSVTDLKPNQSLINDEGITFSGINEDILGAVRSNPPDIGATEFDPCIVDASMTQIISPTSPLVGTTHNVIVELSNQGTANLTSGTINWTINGVAQAPFNWSGNIPYQGSENVNLGSHNFVGSSNYSIQAWLENPNNTTDCNLLNDTTVFVKLYGSLCGSYTVGGINPDFANFTEVADALNNVGITCPVTFVVRDGVYEEQINIVNVPGNSLVNTVTFLGESGDSSLVTLSYSDANNILDYTLNLENTYGFTFRDIGFSRGSNSYVIKATNSNSLKIDRCHFHSDYMRLVFETGTDIHFSNSYFTRNHFYLSDSIYGFSLEHNIGLGHFECQNSSYVDSLYIYNNTFPHGNNFRFGRYSSTTNAIIRSNEMNIGTFYWDRYSPQPDQDWGTGSKNCVNFLLDSNTISISNMYTDYYVSFDNVKFSNNDFTCTNNGDNNSFSFPVYNDYNRRFNLYNKFEISGNTFTDFNTLFIAPVQPGTNDPGRSYSVVFNNNTITKSPGFGGSYLKDMRLIR